MRKKVIYLLIPFILIVAFSPSVVDGETYGGAFHQHHLSLFVGNTQEGFSDFGFSIGVDYEYRFNWLFGLGGTVEYAGGDFEHWLALVQMVFHPSENWGIIIAPGTEIKKGEHERDFIFRVGVGYQFHLSETFTIAPVFDIDFSDGETLVVYGVQFGFGF